MINLTILPPSFYNLPPPFEKVVVVGGGGVCVRTMIPISHG